MSDMLTAGVALLGSYLVWMVLLVHIKRDVSIANFTWGGGCLLAAVYTYFAHDLYLSRHNLITALIGLWAVRMITYLYMRYTGKDPRFEQWRKRGSLLLNIVYVFGVQAALMMVMSFPGVWVNLSTTEGLTWLDWTALGAWVVGFYFEAVADFQLFYFVAQPENSGKIMTSGLWRYSRHPNYFGEIVMWWSIFLIACNVPWGFTTIVAPLTITGLLCFVTGIPLVERVFADNPEYQEYKKRTSALFPWRPR